MLPAASFIGLFKIIIIKQHAEHFRKINGINNSVCKIKVLKDILNTWVLLDLLTVQRDMVD